ncbi:DUF3224 domain-containing protein [Alteromonas flava]|uniref:DUF3224 domain-containing protein n=1 Tax=Alteromonas flava TaxID=2048003 RepID=UPI00196B7905|nr:DUF3224 domain-containing protein [Alteromonas flava]
MRRSLAKCLATLLIIGLFGLTQNIDAATYEKGSPMQTAKGQFNVQLQPQKDLTNNAGRLLIDKSYTGDFSASGTGQMLSHRTHVEGSAGYVAIETIDGELNGQKGTFVMQHSGSMAAGEQHLSITIIADSGTGELTGISGYMEIDIREGQHFYSLHYQI